MKLHLVRLAGPAHLRLGPSDLSCSQKESDFKDFLLRENGRGADLKSVGLQETSTSPEVSSSKPAARVASDRSSL
ncbi:hypothetical protein VZT92_017428 [Zoarces viviparus]|uniref:Uncharacterized protein n=1 Tax=Zoarces viviparus TaxID=48416 RepID=A0AAW1ES80_ZOAVI